MVDDKGPEVKKEDFQRAGALPEGGKVAMVEGSGFGSGSSLSLPILYRIAETSL